MALQTNMGEKDRNIRLGVATVLIIISFTPIAATAGLKMLLSFIALVLVATSWFRVCPAYIPFKIDTRGK